jgi:hypothetical protein
MVLTLLLPSDIESATMDHGKVCQFRVDVGLIRVGRAAALPRHPRAPKPSRCQFPTRWDNISNQVGKMLVHRETVRPP